MRYKNMAAKRKIVREYICKNPTCTYKDIKKATKLKIERLYKNMKEAYYDADVPLSKNLTKRDESKQKRDVINFIKENPGCTVTQIQDKTRTSIPRIFGTIKKAYKCANREYPERKITQGVMSPDVIKRCNKFEKRIIELLKTFGEVKSKIRTSAGIVDCLLNLDNQFFVVEIKDFRGRNNITMSQIKQLIKYMKVLNYNNGLIICPKESFPKRKNGRNIYINDLSIKILSEEDLRGCSIKEKLSVQPG